MFQIGKFISNVHPGDYSFLFCFTLPENLPGSFYLQKPNKTYLKYTVTALLTNSDPVWHQFCCVPLSIVEKAPINENINIRNAPAEENEECPCCPTGTSFIVGISTDRKVISAGDLINIELRIKKNGSKSIIP